MNSRPYADNFCSILYQKIILIGVLIMHVDIIDNVAGTTTTAFIVRSSLMVILNVIIINCTKEQNQNTNRNLERIPTFVFPAKETVKN